MASPFSTADLKEAADKACEQALGSAETYDHASAKAWNDEIISSLLKSLVGKADPPSYKYICNSTIIQHAAPSSDPKTAGRRGMHSASGAYWDSERDGTWSYKWEGAESKGMDVVIAVTWIAL